MKIYIVLAMLMTTTIVCADNNKDPEEAHVYWTNKVTNNNTGETTAEFHAKSMVHTTAALDEETYKQLKEQLIVQLKEELKNDPEFMDEVIRAVLEELRAYQKPPGVVMRFGM